MEKLLILIVAIFIFSIKLIGQEEWSSFEIGSSGNFSIHIKVKNYACAADTNWLGFEFKNESNDTLVSTKYCSYEIKRVANGWSGNLSANPNYYPFYKENYNRVVLL